MKIAVFGTGIVGQTIGSKLVSLGYDVMIGTRDVKEARARNKDDMYGGPGFGIWVLSNDKIKLGTFAQAASFGELIVNATNGSGSIAALKSVSNKDLDGKIILDIANPLDSSTGMPPSLLPGLSNTNSLGEEIQRTFPNTKVVKSLNTITCGLMVNPGMIGGGDHINYICGNDQEAKRTVKGILTNFGWKNECLLDLGDISNARGTEAVLPIWLRVWGATQTGLFNFRLIK